MTNVVVATNETNWRGTNGFAAWTNNYLWDTNVWAGETSTSDDDDFGYQLLIFAPYKFRTYNAFLPVGFAYETNAFLQAKDTRGFDCERALMERWFVLGTNNTITNYYTFAQGSLPTGYRMGTSYKDERFALQRCKRAAKNLLPYYYLQSSNEFPVVCTESSVCTRAGVPTNFLSNTEMYRAPDGTWTPYTRIMTSTWTLATTSSGVVTNATVDSWGGAVTLIGTNGQQFSKIITNTAILTGKRAEDYGWDAMKAVITNLTMTARNGAWGIGYGSNTVSDAYKSNFTCSIDPYTNSIPGTFPTTEGDAELTVRTTNGWAAGDSGYAEPWTSLPWAWFWTNEPAYLCETGQPPVGIFSANYRYAVDQRLQYNGSSLSTWNASILANTGSATHTNSWKSYQAPLAQTLEPRYGRTLNAWITSNSVNMLWEQTNIPAGNYSYTSAPYIHPVPSIPANFGIDTNSPAFLQFAVDWNDKFFIYQQSLTRSASTNNAYPTIGASKVFETWEFRYR
jgi:hypothetical protein